MRGHTLNILNQYRKRKSIPLDGNIGRLPYARYRSGRHYAAVPLPLGGAGASDMYDPGHAFYQDSTADYTPPDPWFEHFHVAPTPMIRHGHPEWSTTPATEYEGCVMTPDLLDSLWAELQAANAPSPLEFGHEPAIDLPVAPTTDSGAVEDQIPDPSCIDSDATTPLCLEESVQYTENLDVQSVGEMNLEQIIFESMAGVQPDQFTPDAGAELNELSTSLDEQVALFDQEALLNDQMMGDPQQLMQPAYEDPVMIEDDPYMMLNAMMPGPFGPAPGM